MKVVLSGNLLQWRCVQGFRYSMPAAKATGPQGTSWR